MRIHKPVVNDILTEPWEQHQGFNAVDLLGWSTVPSVEFRGEVWVLKGVGTTDNCKEIMVGKVVISPVILQPSHRNDNDTRRPSTTPADIIRSLNLSHFDTDHTIANRWSIEEPARIIPAEAIEVNDRHSTDAKRYNLHSLHFTCLHTNNSLSCRGRCPWYRVQGPMRRNRWGSQLIESYECLLAQHSFRGTPGLFPKLDTIVIHFSSSLIAETKKVGTWISSGRQN